MRANSYPATLVCADGHRLEPHHTDRVGVWQGHLQTTATARLANGWLRRDLQ